MFAMFKQFFLMFSTLFNAGERFASAINHIAISTDEMAAAYADEARIERQKKLANLKAELKAVESKANSTKAA